VPYVGLIQHVLGNYASVNETITALKNDVCVTNPRPNLIPKGLFQHFAIDDAHGDHAIIEYLNGAPVFTLNGVGVMTNGPDLDWQLRNLNNYASISPEPVSVRKGVQMKSARVGVVPSVGPNGGNLLGLPGDYSPSSRFVRTFFLRQLALTNEPPKDLVEALSIATVLLDNVRVIPGTATAKNDDGTFALVQRLLRTVEPSMTKYDYTQIDAIKLPKSKTFLFRTYENSQWRALRLGRLDLTAGATPKELLMFDGEPGVLDVTGALH